MNKLTPAIIAGFLATSGCASEAADSRSAVGRCSSEGMAWAIGRPADPANGRRLFQQSGAGLWRVITPERAVLADYRDDRLNVHVDSSNVITSVDCG